jgi:hypothetical protein
MIGRRQVITLLGGAAAWPFAARAQQRERMRRIGMLVSLAADDQQAQVRNAAFLQGLANLGWNVGRNPQIDYRWGGGDSARYTRYAAELAARQWFRRSNARRGVCHPIGAVTRNAGPKRPKPPKTVHFARVCHVCHLNTGGDTPPIRVTQRRQRRRQPWLPGPQLELERGQQGLPARPGVTCNAIRSRMVRAAVTRNAIRSNRAIAAGPED